MAGTPFDESKVVNGLRKSSSEFNNFYQNERLKYRDEIEWFEEPDLAEGLNAYADVDRDEKSREIKTLKIYFKKFPDANDALLIAHEIMHVIRAIENKSIGFKIEEPYSFLAKPFGNMIEDPIVDSFLNKKYNFNLLVKYKEDLILPKRQIDQMDKEPNEKARRLDLMINLIKKELCWDLIKERETKKEWADFQKAFKEKCPNVWGMSREFLTFIKKDGYDTKIKQEKIMEEIQKSIYSLT